MLCGFGDELLFGFLADLGLVTLRLFSLVVRPLSF